MHQYRDDLYCSAQVSWDDQLIEAVGAVNDSHDDIKPFTEIVENLKNVIANRRAEAKKQVESSDKKDKKRHQAANCAGNVI